ncbi:MAG: response regulator, partial [Pseudorhodoplanes sp.]
TARDMRPGLPVVFASGRWSRLEQLQSVPNSVILQKPYSLTRACEAVSSLVKPVESSNAWA